SASWRATCGGSCSRVIFRRSWSASRVSSMRTSSHPEADASAAPSRLTVSVRIDVLIAAALTIVTMIAAFGALQMFRARGDVPPFYQSMFEPAVAAACGRGFVRLSAAQADRQKLDDFLAVKRDRFDCADLPARSTPQPDTVTGTWPYLFRASLLVWRVA